MEDVPEYYCGLQNVAECFFFCFFLIGPSAALLHMRWEMVCHSWAPLFGGENRDCCWWNAATHVADTSFKAILEEIIDWWKPFLNTEFESILEILSPDFWNKSALSECRYVWVSVKTKYDHWISETCWFYSIYIVMRYVWVPHFIGYADTHHY